MRTVLVKAISKVSLSDFLSSLDGETSHRFL